MKFSALGANFVPCAKPLEEKYQLNKDSFHVRPETHSLFINSTHIYTYIKAKSVGALNESHQGKLSSNVAIWIVVTLIKFQYD